MMNSKDRIELFLKYQNQNMSFEDISEKLEMKPATLRRNLNKNGYKSEKGIYVKSIDESQISFDNVNSTKKSSKSKLKTKDTKEKSKTKETIKPKEKVNKKKSTIPKKDKKINICQDDIDKLCEVYDWYIEVKDNKVFRPKKVSNKKDIVLDTEEISDVKSANIRVDKQTWEDFERLCSNSSYNKKEILTQALKDFMKVYKNLL
ncbi:DNA-binding protein [Terrisporobacter hibernicus]|uniref:DNA-binding protein n=3 Tax=Terrisporobacter TaxID=1505652 RepID=A0AAX2ZKJ5_9FIRM|nr:DNA-binding protein [Terrisporobacter glycolicus]UEL49854.1 DNA-binding protein [Terrisporobacter hibernicus]